jgi:hypothetical protein
VNARDLICAVVEDWALWRDGGDFDRLATCWHPGGRMATTWGDFDAAGFVTAAQAAWDRGMDVIHLLGGTSVDVVDDRAVAQTRMTIQQRGLLDGSLVDVTCTGRFYDLFERRDDRWAIVLRQPIYERDRVDPLVPGAVIALDADQLGRFPIGYRHLACLQAAAGMTVAPNLPGLRGPAVDALYARGTRWLAG